MSSATAAAKAATINTMEIISKILGANLKFTQVQREDVRKNLDDYYEQLKTIGKGNRPKMKITKEMIKQMEQTFESNNNLLFFIFDKGHQMYKIILEDSFGSMPWYSQHNTMDNVCVKVSPTLYEEDFEDKATMEKFMALVFSEKNIERAKILHLEIDPKTETERKAA